MKKTILLSIVCLLVTALPSWSMDLELKSGKTFSGDLVEKGDDFVRIDTGSNILKIPLEKLTVSSQKLFETRQVNDYVKTPVIMEGWDTIEYDVDVTVDVMEIWDNDSDKNEPHEKLYDDGTIAEKGPMQNGKAEGLFHFYYPDSTLKAEINFHEGKQHGLAKWFWLNGNPKFQCEYNNGKEEGLCKFFNESGTLALEEKYVDGQMDFSEINVYDQDGNRWCQKSGDEQTLYYPNGQKKLETNEEESLLYSESGHLLKKAQYEKDKTLYTEYNEHGNVVKEYAEDKEPFEIYLTEAEEYAQEGKSKEALESYLKAYEIKPNDFDLNFIIAQYYFKDAKFQESLPYLQKSANLKPNHFLANLYAGISTYDSADYQGAITYLEKAESLAPDRSEPYFYLGRVYFWGFADYERSEKMYAKAYALNPNDPHVHYELGGVYFKMGAMEKAEEYLKSAREIYLEVGNNDYVESVDRSLALLEKKKSFYEDWNKYYEVWHPIISDETVMQQTLKKEPSMENYVPVIKDFDKRIKALNDLDVPEKFKIFHTISIEMLQLTKKIMVEVKQTGDASFAKEFERRGTELLHKQVDEIERLCKEYGLSENEKMNLYKQVLGEEFIKEAFKEYQ